MTINLNDTWWRHERRAAEERRRFCQIMHDAVKRQVLEARR